MGFKHIFSASYTTGYKRVVATHISSALNYEHLSKTKDIDRRFVEITGRIEGPGITLLNVYVPP